MKDETSIKYNRFIDTVETVGGIYVLCANILRVYPLIELQKTKKNILLHFGRFLFLLYCLMPCLQTLNILISDDRVLEIDHFTLLSIHTR